MKINYISLFLLTALMALVSCTSSDLAFDIVESPVLIEFDGPDSSAEMLTVTATVYELDKSGILDNAVGITSTAVSGLSLTVYTDEDTVLDQVTTNSEGVAVFTKAWSEVGSVSRLEWTGEHNGVAFRIYKNI